MDDKTREILERPFLPADIAKDYSGNDFVKPHLVIRRLNDAFGIGGWEFVLEERVEDAESVTQFGKLGFKGDDGGTVWKHNCGGMDRKYKKGQPHTIENQINAVTDYKGAISNCLKRCAMMIGVALDLYGDPEHEANDADSGQKPPKERKEAPQKPAEKPTGEIPAEADAGKQGAKTSDMTKIKAVVTQEESAAQANGLSGVDVKKLRATLVTDETDIGQLRAYCKALRAASKSLNNLDRLPDTPA